MTLKATITRGAALLPALCLAGLCGSAHAQQFECTITPLSTNYMVEEPVLLKLTTRNIGSVGGKIYLGHDGKGAFRFGTNEHSLLTNSLLRTGGLMRMPSRELRAGERYDETIVLDEWLRLPPGEHTVICENSAANLQARFHLTILPLDRDALRARIASLIKRAQRWGYVDFGDPAAEALRAAVRRSALCKEIVATAPQARAELKSGLENDPVD